MKRIQEKVKDLVEVRVYRSLQNFTCDPAETLAAYHFTDVTAEMMAKWLDSLSRAQMQNGAARALAGYRGVGKSHFFATFEAIISNLDLRSKITDSHVAAAAQQLKRKRYPVAFAKRGTHETLLEEIKDAIARVFELDAQTLSDDLQGLLNFAAEKSGELPFVLLIDTAFERASRVVRDDGAFLGELAEIARDLNFFVAVALDDDIAGADGVNAAIVQNYTVDYLDQEHLYRVVEKHIFPKNRQSEHVLHDIYENFREVLTGFRWSEQRFFSLYPVHPVILETAQFIRLYAPEFALLGFASEAGNKVLGRPANSLVALDEVFDRVENSLRKAPDLNEAFETFDLINARVIADIPVMRRLQAKLVLKALFLLSLSGDGATANEIGAAMLIYDEGEPAKSLKGIEDLLEKFVSVFPEEIKRKADDERETGYSFKVSGKDSLNDAVATAAQEVSNEVFESILRRLARERFSDWASHPEEDQSKVEVADCQIEWRGSFRRGRIIWNSRAGASVKSAESATSFIDWEVFIGSFQNESENSAEHAQTPVVVWQAAPLRVEEEEALRRFHVLLTDKNLQENFGEQIRAASHAQQNAVKNIWNRIFLEDGKLLINGAVHSFSENVKTAASLAELFSQVLTPFFETCYPQHPQFAGNLGINEVATLVSEHFSGSKPTLPEVQELAKTFALPLGLVFLHGNFYILNSDEKRLNQPFVREIMSLVAEKGGEPVLLKTIYAELKKEPYGLVHESVHLILAALVAQRHLEFVTTKGDRINRRSLDLKIIWDDISGVATPTTVLYGSSKLTKWARTLTGVENFKTIDDPEDREKIKTALEDWLLNWREAKILEKFEELPAEILTTRIWRLASHAEKTFGIVAATIESVSDESISLEEGLQRVADAFSDSEEVEFANASKDLVTLKDFINGAELREIVWKYLAVCEATDDAEIESLRERIFYVIEEMSVNPNEDLNRELAGLWREFQPNFAEHYAAKHYAVMKSHHLQEKFAEILQSDEWWEFENLSTLPIFQKTYWKQAQAACRRFKELNCNFDVREILETNPFCACSFRLSQMNEWEKLPQNLSEIISQGRKSYRKTLSILGEALAPQFEHFAQNEKSNEFVEAAARLWENIRSADTMPLLKNAELVVLKKAVQSMPPAPLLQISLPDEKGFLTREELRRQMSEWLDELPSEPVLLKI